MGEVYRRIPLIVERESSLRDSLLVGVPLCRDPDVVYRDSGLIHF